MSALRDALEAAQARLRAAEEDAQGEERLRALVGSLRFEAEQYERLLQRAEARARREHADLAGRLMATGFSVLFGMPIVVMMSSSLAKAVRSERELAVALMLVGTVVIAVTLSNRASGAVVRWVSPEWRLVRRARRLAASLETTSPSPLEGRGSG